MHHRVTLTLLIKNQNILNCLI